MLYNIFQYISINVFYQGKRIEERREEEREERRRERRLEKDREEERRREGRGRERGRGIDGESGEMEELRGGEMEGWRDRGVQE